MRVWILVALAGVTACAGRQEVWGGRSASRETQAVQEATVRWFAVNYEPSEFLGNPQALCLVVAQSVGRRDLTATMQAARDEDMDPPAILLSRLRRVTPKVLPISACVYGNDLSETIAETGERAIVLGVGYPEWVTPNLARLNATIRENQQTWYRYRCSLVREEEGWRIRRCT